MGVRLPITEMEVGLHNHHQNLKPDFQSILQCQDFDQNRITALALPSLSDDVKYVTNGIPSSNFWRSKAETTQFSRDESPETSPVRGSESVIVCGSDISDLPTRYTVTDLRELELPVIGTYIDGNILPGFMYRIRLLGSNKYLFKEMPLTLVSIGMGYGKRITMEGDADHYFYSDTYADGCGFQIVAVRQGEKFIIRDSRNFPVGKAMVEYIHSQKELSTEIDRRTGVIEKIVRVSFTCSVKYGSEPHGLLPLFSNTSVQITAPVFLVKSGKSKKALVTVIKDIHLQRYGKCSFQPSVEKKL